MYVKITDGQIEKFPYSINDLRNENKETSFPKNPSASILAEWGVYAVKISERPQISANEKAEQNSIPFFENDEWILGWTVNEKPQEQINQETESKITSIRLQRNGLLSQCDWTQLTDSPLTDTEKSEWAVYRQALRDITTQPNFPENISWPTEPGVNL